MLLSKEHCPTCNAVTNHHNGRCSGCSAREQAEREAKWNAMSLQEKIELLRAQLEQLESRDIMDG